MTKNIFIFALISSTIIAQQPRLIITPELMKEYKTSFATYLKSKEHECNRLRNLTDNSRWYGGIMASVIEFTAPLLGLGNVDVNKAKQFLGRVFDENKKQLLQDAIAKLESSEDNRAYLQQLFDSLDLESYKKKARPRIVEAMHHHKHKKVPHSEKLGDKNDKGEYLITDANFFPYAVSNLFAFHILESDLTIQKLGIDKPSHRSSRKSRDFQKKLIPT
jgi:hypothetical protein